MEGELKNAKEEIERPFPKEEELETKSIRLAQLNRELEKPKKKDAEQTQDGDNPDSDDGSAPPRDSSALSVVEGGKPSIRQAIRDFSPPAPVRPAVEHGQWREAAL